MDDLKVDNDELLDELDQDDYFGTEGWKHQFSMDE